MMLKTHPFPINAVDLFCGAGGLTRGLVNAGIKVRLGIDLDPICHYPYTHNNKGAEFLEKSVTDISSGDILPFYERGALKLLGGCAPCQTFSKYNKKATDTDQRWWLLREFSRLVEEISPELVTMENVPGLREQNVFDEFVASLKNLGFHVTYKVVSCAEYGIPQYRSRLVLLASTLGPIQILSPKEFKAKRKTLKDALGNLPALMAGGKSTQDPLHQSSKLSALNLQRIRSSTPGGTWRDWPEELVAECHKKSSGETYASVYGRMCWDEPAPTITTQFYGYGNGRFGHPEQDRAISLREGAIIQSFPRNYKFAPKGAPICFKNIGRLIGNAVPVKLGEVIGKSIVQHVKENICGSSFRCLKNQNIKEIIS